MSKREKILFLILCAMFLFKSPREAISSSFGVIRDAANGYTMTVNPDGRADVIQHSHIDSTMIHFHVDGLSATTSYILVDISNIGSGDANYKHTSTDHVHIEWLQLEVDGNVTADYDVNFEFLENVDGTDGDRYIVKHFSGTRTVGQSFRVYESFYPNGWRCRKESITTHGINLNDADWSTADSYGDTLSPAGSVNPGTGDLIMIVTVDAGTIDLAVNIGYHSH